MHGLHFLFGKRKISLVISILLLMLLQVTSQLGHTASLGQDSSLLSPSPGQLTVTPTSSSVTNPAASAVVSAASSVTGTCVSSWPQFHGDGAHSGFSCFNGPLNNSTLWTYQLPAGHGGNNGLISTSHELIVTSVTTSNLFINFAGLFALFEQNGTLVPLPNGNSGYFYQQACCLASVYPASDGALVYFSEYDSPRNLYLQADFVATGGGAYLHPLNTPLNCNPYYTCSVFFADGLATVYNGNLLVADYNTPIIGGYVAQSGLVVWPQESLKGSIDTLPTGGGTSGEFVVGYANFNLLAAVNATTGKAVWNFTTGAPVVAAPAFANGNFYFGTAGGTVYSLSSTEVQNWSVNLGSGVIDSTPAVAYGDAFVATDDNHIYALNATTGAKLWTFTGNGPFLASPAISSNKILYDGSTGGILYALNVTNGHLIWSYDTGSPITASPVLDSINANNVGALFVVNQRGKVFAFPDPAPAVTPALTPLPQWSQFQGSAGHDGNSSFIGPRTPLLSCPPRLVGGTNDALVADNHQVIVTSNLNNQVVALGEQDCSTLFTFFQNSAGPGTAYPASQGGLVFFSTVVGVVAGLFREIFPPLDPVLFS